MGMDLVRSPPRKRCNNQPGCCGGPGVSAILDRRVPPSPSTQIRNVGLALAGGTVLIAFFVTQWPFEYRLTSFAVRVKWNRIDWSWFPRTPAGIVNRDFVLNLLMLIPLGIGFGLWRRAARWRVAAEALALGIVTAATLELAQLATRSRYTSFPDFWRNSFGCVVGCVLALAIRRCATRRRDSGARPRSEKHP
jgi:hypothetical protein